MTLRAGNEYVNKCYRFYNKCRSKYNSNNRKMRYSYRMSILHRHNQMK